MFPLVTRISAILTNDTSPSFLFRSFQVSFHRPHSPYDPPLRHLAATVARGGLAKPARAADGWDAMYARHGNWSAAPYGALAPAAMFCGDIGLSGVARSRAAYMASVAFVDEQIGALLDEVSGDSFVAAVRRRRRAAVTDDDSRALRAREEEDAPDRDARGDAQVSSSRRGLDATQTRMTVTRRRRARGRRILRTRHAHAVVASSLSR